MRSTLVRLSLAALTVLAVTSACDGSDGPRPSSSPSPSPSATRAVINPPAKLRPLAVGAALLRFPLVEPTLVGTSGGIVVVTGDEKDLGPHEIAVLDTGNGKVLWKRTDGASLGSDTQGRIDLWQDSGPTIVGSGKAALLVVNYFAERTDEHGIAALRLADGSLAWSRTLATERSADDNWFALSGGAGQVLATYASSTSEKDRADVNRSSVFTLGLDPRTGKTRWKREGLYAERVAGDVIVGQSPRRKGETDLDYGAGSLQGIDLRTGRLLWTVPANGASDGPVGALGDYVLFFDPAMHTVFRSAEDGSVLPIDEPRAEVFSGDGTLLAWSELDVPDYRLVTLAPGETRAQMGALHLPDGAEYQPRVVQGYILSHPDASGRTTAFDRSGTVVGEALPGDVLDITDDQVIVSEGDSAVVVYRRK